MGINFPDLMLQVSILKDPDTDMGEMLLYSTMPCSTRVTIGENTIVLPPHRLVLIGPLPLA